MSISYCRACAALLAAAGISLAQPSPLRDAWLMQNYRFTGPPPAGEIRPAEPPGAELQEIQNTVLAILRKSNFAGDFEAALAAAWQAATNVQLRTALAERPPAASTAPTPAIYLVALKDQTIQAATSYWVAGPMLNYITLQGAHEQVRLDLVDRGFSSELNRQRNLEFRLPEK